VWARDYDEIKALGSKNSTRRTTEQTEITRFWDATQPPIYDGVVRSVATVPGREVTQNARLFMAVAQATDDALIAVFDAKYHYNFWRPVTAIRNGDIDGNDATEREPSWTPFIDPPMHPEYPCAHCIVSGAVGTVLQAEIGTGPMLTLTTTSPTAKRVARSWTTIDDFMQEVANGRIYDGVHYRNSRKSAQPWANRLARWLWRSTCGRSSRTSKLGHWLLRKNLGQTRMHQSPRSYWLSLGLTMACKRRLPALYLYR